MTESIDLSYQTALFERKTGIPVDDDGKGFLYSNIAEVIKSVIYVSKNTYNGWNIGIKSDCETE